MTSPIPIRAHDVIAFPEEIDLIIARLLLLELGAALFPLRAILWVEAAQVGSCAPC